jgi:ABC-type Fe3+-hydroxamate transport system substrate-binding protein
MTKDEQIAKFLTYSMEDIREENPQYIFEMWMYERRKHEAEISAKQQTINGLLADIAKWSTRAEKAEPAGKTDGGAN